MWRSWFCVLIACFIQNVVGSSGFCDEPKKNISCTTQLLGRSDADYNSCKIEVYPANSQECSSMKFMDIAPNTHIGGVTLKPHIIMPQAENKFNNLLISNRTVLNITFSNIKWKTMKFRFQYRFRNSINHCSHIRLLNNVAINENSVLYYDCYWRNTDLKGGDSHMLDFEATGENTVNRGQYYFNIPSAEMLSQDVKAENWKPFVYIEIIPSTMSLHIMPPPSQLKIIGYKIQVMRKTDQTCNEESTSILKIKNTTDEAIYNYNYWKNGDFYFVVVPLHRNCSGDGDMCKSVESPIIKISLAPHTLNICIASVTALVVATLFAYYIALRVIRRYWCKDYKRTMSNEIPLPTKVLVIYSHANNLHARCVSSLVAYLRHECWFDVLYDGDICNTSHSDPYLWAVEAFRLASHVMYVVGPGEDANQSIYDKPILSAYKDVDRILLSFVKANRTSRCRKEIFNVFFEHSNGQIPVETRHDRVFFLLDDWNKMTAYLSSNILPKRQLVQSDKGKCLLDDLRRAKEVMNDKKVIVHCEKTLSNDKKIAL